MRLEIREAKVQHCGQIARLLRVDQSRALMLAGVPIHRELRGHFERSFYRRVAFVDGHLAALWGAEGSLMASTALVWLALSQYALKFPVTVLRQARREIEMLARTKTIIVTTIIPDDEAAHRLVMFLGFESPDGFGGGPARNRSARWNIMRYTRSAHQLMVTIGGLPQVEMIYRPEQHRSS